MEEQDRRHALQLQEALDREERGAAGGDGGALSAEERDRLHAMRLQEEFESEDLLRRQQQEGGHVGAMSPEQLEAYRRAERDYFRQREQQRGGGGQGGGVGRGREGGAAKKSSSCQVS
jgi:hypothetical protein